jgi:phosphate transport system substrate-binding protein
MRRAYIATAVLLTLAVPAAAQRPFTVQRVQTPSAIWVDGSTGVMPLVTVLAAAHRAATPFAASINFGQGLGSAARIAAVKDSRIDIALASHGVVIADLERQGLKVHKFAEVPVGFAVPKAVGVDNLTEAQVCDIYAGRISNWKALGGIDLPIVPVSRPKGEVDADVIAAGIPCMASLAPHPRVVMKEQPEEMAAFLEATPGTIGMTSATVTWQSTNLRLVTLGGVAPSAANVTAGRYRHFRESFLIVSANPRPEVGAFVGFIVGPAGARIITQSGGIPK